MNALVKLFSTQFQAWPDQDPLHFCISVKTIALLDNPKAKLSWH